MKRINYTQLHLPFIIEPFIPTAADWQWCRDQIRKTSN